MKAEEYFADKIERTIRFYKSCSKKIDGAYLAEVARVAGRFKDDLLARFFCETVQPSRIAERLYQIRLLMKRGEIIEADCALESFKSDIELIERHLAHRYLTAGIKTSYGGKKSAAAKWGSVDGRADKMRRTFEKEQAKWRSKGKAEQAVARSFLVSTRTVRTARTGK